LSFPEEIHSSAIVYSPGVDEIECGNLHRHTPILSNTPFSNSTNFCSSLLYIHLERYIGYGKDQAINEKSYKGESVMSLLCLVQSVLLGSFAAILGAHRSEILDKPSAYQDMSDFPSISNRPADSYDPPTRGSTDSGQS
jgi:hypothetical protein